jgi:mRNA interferase MazF
MTFDRFDVVVVPFPFVDRPVQKRRPVAILSNRSFHDGHQHILACMITTGANSAWPSDIAITDLEAAGLSHHSILRWKVFTLPSSLIIRRIGRLAEPDRAALALTQATMLFA